MPKSSIPRKGAQRAPSALKGAANDMVEYLFIANQEKIKALPPEQKALLMSALKNYQEVVRHNAAANKRYFEALVQFYKATKPELDPKEAAKKHMVDHPINTSMLKDSSAFYNEIKTQLFQASPPEVYNTKREIYNQLVYHAQSPLNIFLRNLPEDKKISLVAAIITGDGEKIAKMLFPGTPPECPLIADKAVLLQTFKSLGHAEPFEIGHNTPLRIAATVMIKAIAKPRDNQPPLSPLALKGQEILFFEQVMKTIPDVDLTPKLKNDLLNQCVEPGWAHLVDPFYFESAHPDDPHKAQLHGKISAQQLLVALNDPKMDNSEFIMLSLGLLSKECSSSPELAIIRKAYLERDYERAIAQILALCHDNKTILGEALVDAIETKSLNLVEVDPAKNYNRRYVENALAREYLVNHVNLERINRVSQGISGLSFDISDPSKAVDIVRDAVSGVNDFHKYKHEDIRIRQYDLGKVTAAWNAREKIKREGFERKAEEAHSGGGNIAYSRNVGMMIANQPAPRDEVAEQDQINRTPDKAAGHGKYSPRAARSAMAGDVSGHALWLVARLEAYMKEFPANPPLQDDINEFVKGFVSTYIMRGSHSLDEIYDILRAPPIQEVFTSRGVTLDLSWSEPLVKKAMEAGQDYAKNLALHKAINNEIQAPTEGLSSPLQKQLKATPAPSPKAEVIWTAAEKEMLATIQREDKERLDLIDNLNKLRQFIDSPAAKGNILPLELRAVLPKNQLHQDSSLEVLLPLQKKVHDYLSIRAHNPKIADYMLNDPKFSPLLSAENKKAISAIVATKNPSAIAATPTVAPPPSPEPELQTRAQYLKDALFDTIIQNVEEKASSSTPHAAEFQALHAELVRQKEAFLKGELSTTDFHRVLERAVKLTLEAITQAPSPVLAAEQALEERKLYLQEALFDTIIDNVHEEALSAYTHATKFKSLHAELLNKKEAFLKGELSKPDFHNALERAVKLTHEAIAESTVSIKAQSGELAERQAYLKTLHFDAMLRKVHAEFSLNHANAAVFKDLHAELMRQKEAFLNGTLSKADFRMVIQRAATLSIQAICNDDAKEFLKEKDFDAILEKLQTGISLLQAQKCTHAAEAFQVLEVKFMRNKQDLLAGKITEAQFERLCKVELNRCEEKAKMTPHARALSSELINYTKEKLGLATDAIKHHNSEEQVDKMRGALKAIIADQPIPVEQNASSPAMRL